MYDKCFCMNSRLVTTTNTRSNLWNQQHHMEEAWDTRRMYGGGLAVSIDACTRKLHVRFFRDNLCMPNLSEEPDQSAGHFTQAGNTTLTKHQLHADES